MFKNSTTPKSHRSQMQIEPPKSRDSSRDTKNNSKKQGKSKNNNEKPTQARERPNEVQTIRDSSQVEIKTAWEKVYKIGSGFENVGNTCFLNSVLQMLAYTPPFANYLLNGVHSKKCKRTNASQFCALCSFEKIVKKALSGKFREIEPTEILRNIKQINKKFKIGRQEDSQEFLRDLIDAFQKSATGFIEKPSQQVLENTDISRIFRGKLKSCVECKQCHYKSEIFENFFDLSLELNKSDSIEKCLQVFFRAEELKGANKYRCSGCSKLVDATKKFSIHQRPVVLTIHLKRFDNVFMRISKINRHIEFPETLSLKPYVSEATSDPLIYDLHGMVIHMGSGCSCGHYFSYVKGSNGGWYLMNDEDVRQSNLDKVLKQNAYLLTYVLRGSVQRSASMMEEEVPAGEPAKQEMEIEKPKAKVAAQNGKLNGKLEAMAEKQEKNVPKTPAPVPVAEKKFIQLHNPNEEAKEQKQPVKSQVKPVKATEKMQVEKDSTKIENKTQNNKESKMEIEKKEVAKQIKKTPTEIAVKKQEELPEPVLEKQKSLSEKIFENLTQSIVKTNPTPVLNGLLDDSLDAPSNKRRMEVLPPSLAKSVSKDSLIKDKAEKVVNLIRKPSLQKLEKKDSIVKEETKQEEEKPVKGSVKIETPQIKDYEKMSYSKQLEALLDDREAKVYMDKLEKSPLNKSSLKRSFSVGEPKLQTPAKTEMSIEPALKKSLSFTKQLSRAFSLTLASPALKSSPLTKLKRMAQFISLVPEKKLKRLNSQQGPSATTTLGSLQKQETPVKPPVKNLPSLEALAKQKKINLGNNNVNGNKSLTKSQEVEEWKKGADRDIKKVKKELNGVSKPEIVKNGKMKVENGHQQPKSQKQQEIKTKKIKVTDYPKAMNHVLNR